MSEEEAINHLGTIAKSGSKDFMSEVQESDRKGSKFMNHSIFSLQESINFSSLVKCFSSINHWSVWGWFLFSFHGC